MDISPLPAADSRPAPPALPPGALDGATRLTDWGVIRARGEDAAGFLQGQLTQDVATLADGQATLAGYCNAKGRLWASFIVWKAAPDDILLACSADLLAPTLKRLSMFVLRARCKLSDASAEWALWGCTGPSATALLGTAAPARPWAVAGAGPAQTVRLPDALGQARYLCVAPMHTEPLAGLPSLAPAAWRWLEVHSGVVRITAATSERFVPQMVNFELVGGVSFKKGCYPGQEVVARSQYRGTLKRRVYLCASDLPMAEGREVFDSTDPTQPAGQVALAACWPAAGAGSVALVELKRAAWDGSGCLTLGPASDGADAGAELRRLALPYEIPADAA
jgi:folate-binding protein YgfZ